MSTDAICTCSHGLGVLRHADDCPVAIERRQPVRPAALSAPSEPVRPEPRVPGTAELSGDVQYGYRYRAEGREAWTRTWKCKDRDEAESLVAHVRGEGAVEAEIMTRVVQSWRPEVEKPKCGPDPKIRDTYGEFAVEVFDLEPGNPDCFVVLLRNDEEVKHFTYPAYKIWTLLAHWKEYDEVNPATEVVEP